MKKFFVFAAVSVLVIAATYVSSCKDKKSETKADSKEDSAKQMIARGEYLTLHVVPCLDCHSKRDYSKFAGPIIPGTEGMGGEVFDNKLTPGMPGTVYAKNITPDDETGIGTWTDDEILRAVTQGISKKGDTLFPIMPYANFNHMAKEDLMSIIAYIRTLPPQSNEPPKSEPDFPMNFILNTLPHKAAGGIRPAVADQVAYGAYLSNAADCGVCHTKQEKRKITGEPFAGGFEFGFPGGSKACSANITPDKETGIGNWSEAAFINKFKQYADTNYQPVKLKPGDPQTVMPWAMYAGMDSTDLTAIYAYLKTIKPVNNKVEHWKPKE